MQEVVGHAPSEVGLEPAVAAESDREGTAVVVFAADVLSLLPDDDSRHPVVAHAPADELGRWALVEAAEVSGEHFYNDLIVTVFGVDDGF